MRIGDFFRGYFSNRPSRNHEQAVSRAQSALVFEELEGRILLSSTLFVDFGDNFPNNGTLTTTVGDLDNHTSGTNPNIDGPVLTDTQTPAQNYPANTPVTIQSFNSVYGTANSATAAADRTTIMNLVQRFYAPLDVNVVQNSAASLDDISVALGANEGQTENNDSYVIVGLFTVNGTDNPVGRYGGIATTTDIGSFNNNDGTAFVLMTPFATRESAQFLGDQIAHESGHLFGLRHTFGNNPASPPAGSNIDTGLLQSDMMSYLAYTTFGGFDFFSRYPMVAGDGN